MSFSSFARGKLLRCAPLALASSFACTPATTPSAAAPPSHDVPGAAALLKPGSVLVIGEMHGAEEFPALVLDLAKQAAREAPVTVHLELRQEDQAWIDDLMAGHGPSSPPAKGLWVTPGQYGVTSAARWRLLQDLAALEHATQRVRVQVFDENASSGTTPEDARARDRHMAESVTADVRAHARDVHIVLVGNVHSRLDHGVPWDPEYDPFARILKGAGVPLVSLLGTYSGGAIWACSTPEASSCGVKPQEGNQPGAAPSGRELRLTEKPMQGGHLGFAFVGELHVSAPAIRETGAADAGRN